MNGDRVLELRDIIILGVVSFLVGFALWFLYCTYHNYNLLSALISSYIFINIWWEYAY